MGLYLLIVIVYILAVCVLSLCWFFLKYIYIICIYICNFYLFIFLLCWVFFAVRLSLAVASRAALVWLLCAVATLAVLGAGSRHVSSVGVPA